MLLHLIQVKTEGDCVWQKQREEVLWLHCTHDLSAKYLLPELK